MGHRCHHKHLYTLPLESLSITYGLFEGTAPTTCSRPCKNSFFDALLTACSCGSITGQHFLSVGMQESTLNTTTSTALLPLSSKTGLVRTINTPYPICIFALSGFGTTRTNSFHQHTLSHLPHCRHYFLAIWFPAGQLPQYHKLIFLCNSHTNKIHFLDFCMYM